MKGFSFFAFGATFLLVVFFVAPFIDKTRIKTNEHNTVVFAQVFRSAIDKFGVGHQGRFPARLDVPELQKILLDQMGESPLGDNGLPRIRLGHLGHAESPQVETYSFLDAKGEINPTVLRDTGRWLYDATSGSLVIDCTHTDSKGRAWSSY